MNTDLPKGGPAVKTVKNYIACIVGLIIGFFLSSIVRNNYDWTVLYSLIIGALFGGLILFYIKKGKKLKL